MSGKLHPREEQVDPSVAKSTIDSRRLGRSWRMWALIAIGAGLGALGLTSAATWVRERPLAEADAALDQNQLDTAVKLVSDFLDRDPTNSRALALKARMLVLMGQPAEAIRIFDRIGAASADDMHGLARAYLLQEHWSIAMPLLEQTTRLDPRNSDALYELTSCRVRLGFLQEALASARQFADLPDFPARGHLFVGTIQNDLKNRAEAAAAYAKVLEIDPNATSLQVRPNEFFDEYGRTLLAIGKGEEALAAFAKSRAVQASAANWTLTGRAYASLGRTGEAVDAWQRALTLDTENEESRESLAGVDLQANRPEAALQWISSLADRPRLLSSTAYLFQRAYTMLKDEPRAQEWTKRTEELRRAEQIAHAVESVLIEAPQTFWARVIRTHRFAQQGNWSQAKTLMATLAKEAPDEPFVRDLAKALEQQGDLPPLDRLPIQRK